MRKFVLSKQQFDNKVSTSEGFKVVGGLPLFISCREEIFSETHIQRCESLCVRLEAKGYFASR